MGARDGVELMSEVTPRVVVPVHYEGWSHFRDGREAIEKELARAPRDLAKRFRILPIGVTTSIV
jgi:L-ascorbate metabolism protein UlaG (beta-lactamase superfamily)